MSLQILASLTVDLGVNTAQPIDMSAYSRYVVIGYAVDHLAAPIPSGITPVTVRNAGGATLFNLSLAAASTGNGVALVPSDNQQKPVQPGGDLHAVVGGTLRPGNSVVVHVIGIELL